MNKAHMHFPDPWLPVPACPCQHVQDGAELTAPVLEELGGCSVPSGRETRVPTQALGLLVSPVGVKQAKVWEKFGAGLAQSWCQHSKREALQGIAGMGIIASAIRGGEPLLPGCHTQWKYLGKADAAPLCWTQQEGRWRGRVMARASQEDFCLC